jgi:acetyltransferase
MLGPWRGAPEAQISALEDLLQRVSDMVCALPQLREMDINPVIIDEHGAIAVDARVVVGDSGQAPGNFNPLAILPYPAGLEREWPLRPASGDAAAGAGPAGGASVYRVRPIHPDDAEMLQALVRGVSQESRYFRFASSLNELPTRMLARFTLIDYDREMALVAVTEENHIAEDGSITTTERIVGVSRYVANPDGTSCEFSLLVDDAMKGQGLGTRLMQAIMDVARSKGLSEIMGLILANNSSMLRLMQRLGFQVAPYAEDPDFKIATHAL